MRNTPFDAAVGAVAVILISLGCASPKPSEDKPWGQEAVASLARDLVGAAGDVGDSVRLQPDLLAVTVRRARHRTLDDIRVAQSSIRSLALQLKNGGDRMSTYPTFRRIRSLRSRIAREIPRGAFTEPTPSKVEAARVILDELEPFYAGEADSYDDED